MPIQTKNIEVKFSGDGYKTKTTQLKLITTSNKALVGKKVFLLNIGTSSSGSYIFNLDGVNEGAWCNPSAMQEIAEKDIIDFQAAQDSSFRSDDTKFITIGTTGNYANQK